MSKKKLVKAYLIVLEDGRTVLRYLCDYHYKIARGLQVLHVSLIHSDVYDKKCHFKSCKAKS